MQIEACPSCDKSLPVRVPYCPFCGEAMALVRMQPNAPAPNGTAAPAAKPIISASIRLARRARRKAPENTPPRPPSSYTGWRAWTVLSLGIAVVVVGALVRTDAEGPAGELSNGIFRGQIDRRVEIVMDLRRSGRLLDGTYHYGSGADRTMSGTIASGQRTFDLRGVWNGQLVETFSGSVSSDGNTLRGQFRLLNTDDRSFEFRLERAD